MDNTMPHAKNASNTTHAASLWIAPDAEAMLLRHNLRTPDDFYQTTGKNLTKPSLPSWRQRIRVELTDDNDQPRTLFLKRFTRPPLRVQWRRLRDHRRFDTHAGIEARWIKALRSAGIPVPRILALTEQRIGPWEMQSAILLESVPGESLERLVASDPTTIPRATVLHLADLLQRFHAAGFIHRDLYLSHVFLDTADPQGKALTLIDLQRVLHRPFRHTRWIVRDLAQLHFSTPYAVASLRDRLRFMMRYLGVKHLRDPATRRMLRQIERRAAHFARREKRRAKDRHDP